MSPLSLKILKLLRQNPLGLSLTRIAALTEQSLQNVELSLKALAKRIYVDELAVGAWKIGPRAVDDAEFAAASAQMAERPVYDRHAPKPLKLCPNCHSEKSVIAFFAGDPICRACRKIIGGGTGPGPAIELPTDTPPRARGGAAPGPVPAPAEIHQAPQKLPMPGKPPMPESVREVIAWLEEGCRAIRDIYA